MMRVPPLLAAAKSIFAVRAQKAKRRPTPTRFRPGLESLEDRIVPSSVVYPTPNGETQWSPTETILSPSNVSQLQQVYSVTLDGAVYGTPQIVTNVTITGANAGTYAMVAIVTTEANSVYALNAETGAVLWQTSLNIGIGGATSVTPVPAADVGPQIPGQVGITGGAAIDTNTNQAFVVSYTKEAIQGVTNYVFQIFSLNLQSGTVMASNTIADTTLNSDGSHSYISGPTAAGNGAGSINGAVYFDAIINSQRPDPIFLNGNVYVAFAGHNPAPQYHGWYLSFTESALTPNGTFCTTPGGEDGGIWRQPIVWQNSILLVTGNGTFDTTLDSNGRPVNGDYGDSVVRLSSSTNPAENLQVEDYFTPPDAVYLDKNDLDLDAAGLVVLPPSVGSAQYPNVGFVLGKDGVGYLLNLDNLGGYNPAGGNYIQALTAVPQFQTLPAALSWAGHGVAWSHPAFYNNQLIISGAYQSAVTYTMVPGAAYINPVPATTNAQITGYPGLDPTITSNGNYNGVMFTIFGANTGDTGAANEIEAYNANDGFSQPLWIAPLPSYIKFTHLVDANGMLFAGGNSTFTAWGLPGLPQTPAPINTLPLPEDLVTADYQLLLGRTPSAAEYQAWNSQLVGGKLTPQTLAYEIATSNEARSDLVQSFYQKYLGRSGSAAEVAGWVADLDGGATIEQVMAGFVTSNEYFVQDYASSPSAWVSSLYQNILGRAGSTAEVNAWVSDLSAGAGLSTIAMGFLTSSEYATDVVFADYNSLLRRTPSTQEVQGWVEALAMGIWDTQLQPAANDEARGNLIQALYLKYLGRVGSPTEIAQWVSDLDSGATVQSVIVGILISPEYQDLQGTKVVTWVESLYQNLLGRAGSAAEISNWVGQFSAGASLASIVKGFLNSSEYQSDLSNAFRNELLQAAILSSPEFLADVQP
jgi:hypothetical protein